MQRSRPVSASRQPGEAQGFPRPPFLPSARWASAACWPRDRATGPRAQTQPPPAVRRRLGCSPGRSKGPSSHADDACRGPGTGELAPARSPATLTAGKVPPGLWLLEPVGWSFKSMTVPLGAATPRPAAARGAGTQLCPAHVAPKRAGQDPWCPLWPRLGRYPSCLLLCPAGHESVHSMRGRRAQA